jgi:hypothetical protein
MVLMRFGRVVEILGEEAAGEGKVRARALDKIVEEPNAPPKVEVGGWWCRVNGAGGGIGGKWRGEWPAFEHAKFIKNLPSVAILMRESQGAVGPVTSHTHAKDPLAGAEVLHLKASFDLMFEELGVGANDYQVVCMNLNAAEVASVLMDEETRVNNCRLKVDGDKEFPKGSVPAAGALLEAVE